MRVIVGIGGGIAAYKATSLLRLFSKDGHDVVAMPTPSALEFVGQPTLEALSGNPVSSSVFERVEEVNHVRQAELADLVVVAPATADLMARLAMGRANDLLSATILTTHAPVVLAPAMHTQMWEHPATQANVTTLREFGYHVLDPAVGRLTGPDSGPGRMPEPEDIFSFALSVKDSSLKTEKKPLQGRSVVVTAGGTREPLDPVRFLGNRSSGKQGVALAEAARDLGADVTLIHAHMEVPVPDGVRCIFASSAEQLRNAVLKNVADKDVLIMAAAVADFRPASYEEFKIKKSETDDAAPTISLVRNPDILREVVSLREQQPELAPETIVGFAAETGSATQSVLELGKAKLRRKKCDFLAINEVGEQLGFGAEDNHLTVLAAGGEPVQVYQGSKYDVAKSLLLHVIQP